MNKLKMNKKGIDTMKTVAAIILILILLGVYLYFTSQAASGGRNVVNIMHGSVNDFDNDGVPDSADPCPCGSPTNEKNKEITINGVTYCLLAYDTCPQGFTDNYFTIKEYDRGIQEEEPRDVCVYRKAECMKHIEEQTKK